jgi:protein-S-isoprenylcysteine O-methyltransferase Ste14
MLRVLVRLVADAALVGILLFVSAGTLSWWRAWVLLAVLLVVRTAGAGAVYRVNPALLQERAKLPIHGDQPWTDRHPFYTGTPLVLVGLGLWLESYTSALFAVVPIAFMVMRLKLEERFLRRELPGYTEYTVRVPHRLLPGIW